MDNTSEAWRITSEPLFILQVCITDKNNNSLRFKYLLYSRPLAHIKLLYT